MASDQLHKKSKPGGQQTPTGSQSDSASQQGGQNYGSTHQFSHDEPSYIEQGISQMEECTRDHAGAAILVSLAAGFGIGLAIGCALATPHQPKTWRDRLSAEGIGRQMLDRLEGMIPDALAEYIRK